MFSGFSSYLGYNPQGSESIQALLQKSDLTLDELLDDETLLTELKTLNTELLDFLKKEENFIRMLNHVVFEPNANEQQLNPQRCFKFPLVCTDVLSAECAPLVRNLLNCNVDENEAGSESGDTCDQSRSPVEQTTKTEKENNQDCKYLDHLFSFLDSKELNYTAAGYFTRIITNMFEKFPSDLLAYLYKKRPEQLEKLVNHISSESLTELLLKVLTFEGSGLDDPLDETYNVKRTQIIKLLAQKLDAQQNPELASSAAYILSDLLDRAQSVYKGNEILSGLLGTQSVENLYRILKTKNAGSVTAVASVLESIFKYYKTLAKKDPEEHKEVELKSEVPAVAVTVNNIRAIVGILNDAMEAGVSFGSFRVKLVEFLSVIMEANNSDINVKIVESGFLKVIMKLVLKFEWHSILHNKAEKIIISVLDGKHENLKINLMEDVRIINVLMDAFNDSQVIANSVKGKMISKGYLGQLGKIANKILESHDPLVKKHIENNQEWEDFVFVEIYAMNSKNSRQLGGLNPKIERYGSFEIQNPAVLFSNKPGLNLDYEDQQNDQEGSTEDFKGFRMSCDNQEDNEPTFSIKKAHFKFSQLGADKGPGHRGDDEDQEIVEEVIDTCLSPPMKMKSFKFEEVIDESIEEDIETDQNSDDSNKLKIKL